jgi:predicted site-specific integrase-resolvase
MSDGRLYLTPQEVASMLQCSLRSVYNYTKKGILKRFGFGGGSNRVYYLRSDVEGAFKRID